MNEIHDEIQQAAQGSVAPQPEIVSEPAAAAPAPMTVETTCSAAPATTSCGSLEVAPVTECVVQQAIAVAEPVAPVATVPARSLTDATAQDLESALETAKEGQASKDGDMVARRIVFKRDRWEALLGLTTALRSQRGVVATPAEVAAIVLDAGLNVILEEANAAKRAAARNKAPKAKKSKKIKASRKRSSRTPAKQAVATGRKFSVGELSAVRGLVRGLDSQRSIQRTIGLWIGSQASGKLGVPIEDLRSLCREFKVYDTANFAQNMKKDSAFFAEVRDKNGERLGYNLTAKGVAAANGLLAAKS